MPHGRIPRGPASPARRPPTAARSRSAPRPAGTHHRDRTAATGRDAGGRTPDRPSRQSRMICQTYTASMTGPVNGLSIDFEDWYQPFAARSLSGWETFPSRVPQDTTRMLALLERAGVRCTFFVVGEVAEAFP